MSSELHIDPDEAARLTPAERRELNYLRLLDVRSEVRSAFKGALVGISVNSLLQSFADWVFPTGSSFIILFWLGITLGVLIVFRLWRSYDDTQRFEHVQRFEKERSRRKAREFDPHDEHIAVSKALLREA